MTEYGGDTISGFHTLPSYVWTEDYQCDLVSNHVKVLRKGLSYLFLDLTKIKKIQISKGVA